MDTKLDARQGQFPASFPESFKNFFEMMNEDEDHVDLFANLLEDKVIPRANSPMFVQRQRYGGSLRSHSSHNPGQAAPPQQRGPHGAARSRSGSGGDMQDSHGAARSRSGSSGDMQDSQLGAAGSSSMALCLGAAGVGVGFGSRYASGSSSVAGGSHNSSVDRSSSFRVNRPRSAFSSQTGINRVGFCLGSSDSSSSINDEQLYVHAHGTGSVKETVHMHAHGTGHAERGCGEALGSSGHLLCKHIKCCCLHRHPAQLADGQSAPPLPIAQNKAQSEPTPAQQIPGSDYSTEPANKQQYGGYQSHYASDTRIGPVGADNNMGGGSIRYAPAGHNRQEQEQRPQKRNSVILERAFDFDTSCESDTLSVSTPESSMLGPVPSPAPQQLAYNVLKPILKQTQSQHHQQQQHQQQPPVPASTLLYQPTHVQLPAQPTHAPHPGTGTGHRLLPTPPTNCGMGAYHTREAALQRVQQQSGLLSGSRNNLNMGLYERGNVSGSSYNPQQQQQQQQQQLQQQYIETGSSYNLAHGRELPSPTAVAAASGKRSSYGDFLNIYDGGNANNGGNNTNNSNNSFANRGQSIRLQKSPILNRRRSSSIANNLLHGDLSYSRNSIGGMPPGGGDDFLRMSHSSSSTRDRITLPKSPLGRAKESSVLTFQQAMSGAVSPQYGAIAGNNVSELDMLMGSTAALAAVVEDVTTSGPDATDSPTAGSSDESPISTTTPTTTTIHAVKSQLQQQQQSIMHRERGVGEAAVGVVNCGKGHAHGSSVTIAAAYMSNRMSERQRMRTSSMPAESRKPRLADTRRSAVQGGDLDYYRLRSFSITSHGVCNLGDSLRSRRSRSINSVTSTGTSKSDRHNSNASRNSGDCADNDEGTRQNGDDVPAYKIAMLGAASVGKTTLTYQFTTSDYICAYDLSLDDDYGQKTVSVLVDGVETDLEIIDHPACEMSTEAFCSTYNIDLFVVVYSVVDRGSFKAAEKILHYLKDSDMLLTRGAILVGNKTDLERHRKVTRHMGRKVAKEIACKFIETSSGLDHNVDELLVGIVAQVKLNPQRLLLLSEAERQRLNFQSSIQNHRNMHIQPRRMVRQLSMCQPDEDDEVYGGEDNDEQRLEGSGHERGAAGGSHEPDENRANYGIGGDGSQLRPMGRGQVRRPNKRTLNLESILKMGESELEDEEAEVQRLQGLYAANAGGGSLAGNVSGTLSKFEMLTAGIRQRRPFRSVNNSPKKRYSYDNGPSTSAAAAAAALQKRHAHTLDDYDLGEYDDGAEGGTDCNRKVVTKLTARTKVFLASVLRFKRAIHMRRRHSSSCSDLFVI